MTLIVVGAHALDAELMAGPLAVRANALGWPVELVHLTLGERGHPTKPPEVFGPQLREESHRAGQLLGVQDAWSGAAAPLRGSDVIDWLIAELARLNPMLVITHWRGSWHPSHREAYRVVHRAIASLPIAPTIAYGENCEDLVGFNGTYFVDVSGQRERWLEAVSAYEMFRNSVPGSGVEATVPYWAYYTSALRVHGLHFGVDHAEVCMSDRSLPTELGFRPIPL